MILSHLFLEPTMATTTDLNSESAGKEDVQSKCLDDLTDQEVREALKSSFLLHSASCSQYFSIYHLI